MSRLKLQTSQAGVNDDDASILKFPSGGVFAVAGSPVDAQVNDALEVARSLERTLDEIQQQLDVLHDHLQDDPYHLPGTFDDEDSPAAA